MNSYERVFNRMKGLETDRLPNLCIVMDFAARQIRVPYGKYVTDYRLLAQGVLTCHEKFELDCLNVISDPMREAEGLGAKVVIPDNAVPYSKIKLINDICAIDHLKPVDPSKARRMNDRLQAVSHLKEQSLGEVPVIGWVEGAVAESCDLMDMSMFLCAMIDEPEAAHELLNICLEQASLFAMAQIQAGADIIGIGDAAASLIGPTLYETFALPYQQKLIQRIHDAGAKTKLHICGNLNPVLSLVAKTGADIVDLDHMVNLEKAADIFPDSMCICGNCDPVSILLQGTPKDVRRAVAKSMEIRLQNRNMIAAGCEVPGGTPEGNLLAVKEAVWH